MNSVDSDDACRAFELIATLPEGDRVVGIVRFQDRMLVATERGVWALVNDEFRPLRFVPEGAE